MEIFQLTLFFMLLFFVVIALQVARNRRSTICVCYEGTEYWLLCSKLPPSKKLKVIAYFDKPGFTFGPYIWASIETNEQCEVVQLTEEPEEF